MAKSHAAGLLLLMTALGALGTTGAGDASSVARYGGLGATVAAFRAQNTHVPGFPPLGAAYYTIDQTRKGRVIAFHVEINATPRFANFERLALLAGIDLPLDAREVIRHNTCHVWRSATLKRMIGMAYAVGTTVTGTTRADMQAQRTARC